MGEFARATREARSEHQGNYAACLKGYGYCDRSLLTPNEVRAVSSEHGPGSVIDNQ
jgi:hypothetical protein